MSPGDIEREYEDAKQRADELLARGADPRALADALDALAEDAVEPQVQIGPADDDFDAPAGPATGILASPPLVLDGLPSTGDLHAPITLAILCAPASPNCNSPRQAALAVLSEYPDRVRVVWAPFFDVRGDNATALATLGDAALCAEQVGVSPDHEMDRPPSGGWYWLDALQTHINVRHRSANIEPVIDALITQLHIDRAAFTACRARVAGSTVAWIERARKSGVHTSPATVVGGRIYPPVIDRDTVQQLVAAELAPGVLHEAVFWLGGLATVRAPRE